MATVTKTLKLPFLRLNRVKAEELARLQAHNTEVANAILAMPKAERRKLTTRSFAQIEIGSAWINQTIRKTIARTRVRRFRCLPLETSNQNWTLHKVGETWSVSFGLLRGSKKRVPIEVHTASHRECLEALLDGRARVGSLKLVQSRKGIWYACISVSLEVPDTRPTGRWIGVDPVRGKPRRSGRGRIARTAEPSFGFISVRRLLLPDVLAHDGNRRTTTT
jgi:hypothetical protein